MLARVKEIFEGIPKIALVVVAILVLLGAVWAWKRFSRSDKESELLKGVQNSAAYAQMIQQNLDHEENIMSGTAPEYAKTVQKGLEEFEEEKVAETPVDEEDEFEPFDDEE